MFGVWTFRLPLGGVRRDRPSGCLPAMKELLHLLRSYGQSHHFVVKIVSLSGTTTSADGTYVDKLRGCLPTIILNSHTDLDRESGASVEWCLKELVQGP